MRSSFPNSAFSHAVGQHVTTGNAFFVDSGATNASDANPGTTASIPLATWDGAIGKCTANNGDVIFIMPGHSETVTSAITMDVAGVKVVGLGWGRSRPTITPSGAIDCVTVTAANCWIENVRFVAAASVTAQINVAAADCTVHNCVIEQGAGPLVGMTVASGGDRLTVTDCQFIGTAAGPDVGIDFESSASDYPRIENCLFNYAGSSGCDLGIIRANADTVVGGIIRNCQFLGVDTVAIDMNSSASVSDGLVERCSFHATAALTSIEDIIDAGGYHFFECYAHDGTNATTAAARVPLGTVT